MIFRHLEITHHLRTIIWKPTTTIANFLTKIFMTIMLMTVMTMMTIVLMTVMTMILRQKKANGVNKHKPFDLIVTFETLKNYSLSELSFHNCYDWGNELCTPIILLSAGIGVPTFPTIEELRSNMIIWNVCRRTKSQLWDKRDVFPFIKSTKSYLQKEIIRRSFTKKNN